MIIFVVIAMGSCKEKSKTEAADQTELKGSSEKSSEVQGQEQYMVKENINFFVGTYTNGDSEGIYTYALSPEGKLSKIKLAAKSESPSYLAFSKDRKYLLAANEIKNKQGVGTVSSFEVQGDSLVFVSQSSSGGAHPCFVTINDKGYVVAANYSGGNVGLLKMDKNGTLSDLLDINQHTAKAVSSRQDGPHAHSVWFFPTQDKVIAADLGSNQLWFTAIDSNTNTLEPLSPKTLDFNPGDGPRHLAFHPNGKWIYVLNELSNTVALVRYDEQQGFVKGAVFSMLPEGFKEENTGADIHISDDGKFLYASNRGHNSIVIYSVKDDGALQVVGYESVRGEGPRNFSLSPDGSYVLVANQYSNSIISFRRDAQSGLLSFVDEIEAPSPVCIVF